MYRRPFLVLPGGVCVPLEGEWRIEELRGEWYVLGHNSVHRCETHDQAVTRFAHLTGTDEAEVLASIALEAEIGSALEIDWEFEGLIG
jgi:hypothetical protein